MAKRKDETELDGYEGMSDSDVLRLIHAEMVSQNKSLELMTEYLKKIAKRTKDAQL